MVINVREAALGRTKRLVNGCSNTSLISRSELLLTSTFEQNEDWTLEVMNFRLRVL